MSEPQPNPQEPERRRKKNPRLIGPTKAEMALLPLFPGVLPEQIHVPKTQTECQNAVAEITSAGLSGFDTEAKPTFKAGENNNGPHVVQFALTDKAFIFQLHRRECEKAARELIASEQVLKVGFGLKNDRLQIRDRLGITLNHTLDLDQSFRKLGYGGQLGVRGAVAVLLNQYFKKSKATTMTNWALPQLTPSQLRYAANDAFAALKIMETLQKEGHLEK